MNKSLLKYLVILIGTIILVEFSLSYFIGYNQRPLYIEHPKIEYLLKPNQHLTRFGNEYSVNSFGMRSAELLEITNQSNAETVLVLGDSIVNGGTKISQPELATKILESHLSRATAKRIQVLNISAGSWGPGNLLSYINEYGTFSANIAIVVLSSHDAFDIPLFQALDQQAQPSVRRTSLHEVFLKLTHAKQLPTIQDSVVRKRNLIKQTSLNPELSSLLKKLSEAADTYLIIHRRENELNHEPNSNIEILKNSCSTTGIQCIDTLSIYMRAHKKEPIYFDGLHLNVRGQKILSEALYSIVEKKQK